MAALNQFTTRHATTDETATRKYDAIGGWLIVLAIFLVLLMIPALYNLWVFNVMRPREVTSSELFDLRYSWFVLIGSAAGLTLLLLRLKVFVPFMIVFFGFHAFMTLIRYFNDLALGIVRFPSSKSLLGLVIPTVVIAYLLRSRRVKRTFAGESVRPASSASGRPSSS